MGRCPRWGSREIRNPGTGELLGTVPLATVRTWTTHCRPRWRGAGGCGPAPPTPAPYPPARRAGHAVQEGRAGRAPGAGERQADPADPGRGGGVGPHLPRIRRGGQEAVRPDRPHGRGARQGAARRDDHPAAAGRGGGDRAVQLPGGAVRAQGRPGAGRGQRGDRQAAQRLPADAARVAAILEEAGLPRAAHQMLTGPGERIGERLARSPTVRLVSITGSTAVGIRLARLGAQPCRRSTWSWAATTPPSSAPTPTSKRRRRRSSWGAWRGGTARSAARSSGCSWTSGCTTISRGSWRSGPRR